MKIKCADVFRRVYKAEPQGVFFAPGRVNLIGEHTDYNGGHVFPCAVDLGVYCAAKRRSDNTVGLYSENFADEGEQRFALDDITFTGKWTDYPKAVIRTFFSFGLALGSGFDLAFYGDLPDGAGLSSSAAIEVVTGAVLRELFGLRLTRQQLALIGQFAENRFIGVNCGIMDQFASALGREGSAVLLNTQTLEYSYAPLPQDVSLIVVNSGVKHSLASSAYNERRRQCEAALNDTRARFLCALTPAEFEGLTFTDNINRKRAKHAVYENARTLEAAKALTCGDVAAFGRLMNESHASLRDDYEVSCEELDLLAQTAQGVRGVYGARMTGGGFGGCTVNLVKTDCADGFIKAITDAYIKKYSRTPEIYAFKPSAGVRRVA